MEVDEARMAVKAKASVGTSNVGSYCLFVTGHLVKEVTGGKKKQQFIFKDRHGEITVTRPASQFVFIK